MRRLGPLAALALSPGESADIAFRFKTTRAAQETVRALVAAAPAAPAPDIGALSVLDGAVSIEPLFPPAELRTPATGRRHLLAVGAEGAGAEDETAGLHVARYPTPAAAVEAAAALNADRRVEYAHVIPPRFLFAKTKKPPKKTPPRKSPPRRNTVDPLRNRQWALTAVQLAQAQARAGFKEATDVPVAVIDSGYDNSHPDLAGVVADEQDFTGTQLGDVQGHGTHVIGILAALRNNALGISGLCQSRRVMSLKALGPYNGPGYYRAIRYATTSGARVINLSLGGDHDPTEELLINQAIARGVVVVAAMGNDGDRGNPTSYPAAIPGVVAVGATDELDRRAEFSQFGPHIALVAPGVNILSTVPTYPTAMASTTHYEAWPGTSMATPLVAATVALMFAKRPNATVAQAVAALRAGVDRVQGHTGFTDEYGHGRLNVKKALQAI